MRAKDKNSEKNKNSSKKSDKTTNKISNNTPEEQKNDLPAVAEDKDVTVTETENPKKLKKKDIPVKARIPRLFQKQYTEKKLEKKIYNKIFIPDDKKFVQRLYKPGRNKKNEDVFFIPKDTLLTKRDAKRLKKIAKEIKKQGTRVRWIPLIAVFVLAVLTLSILTATKNKILRTVIVNTCESIFEAKCDIGYLNFSFFDSSFKIKNFEIANKKEPMKNIVDIEYFAVDFDLLQLLRSKFVADELALEGFKTNTDRKYSGDISAKKLAKIQKKKAKQAEKEAKKAAKGESKFVKAAKEKSNAAVNIVSSAVTDLFNEYNPQNVINNCYNNLQTPAAANSAQTEIQAMMDKYKAKPEEIQNKIKETETAVKDISSIDINAIKTDPVKLKDAIDKLNNAKKKTDGLKSYVENSVKDIQNDTNSVKTISANLEKAIVHDKNLAGEAVNKYTSLSLDDGIKFISTTFDSVGYEFLGKYYPYVQQMVEYLIENKNNNKDKPKKVKTKKKKSIIVSRSSGRTVSFDSNKTPKFWIKKMSGSGANFAFKAFNVTSNMDKTGKPATGNVTLTFKDITHTADLTVDSRSYSKDPLIIADYNCLNLPLFYDAANFGNAPGLPAIKTDSTLGATIKIYEDEGFDIIGSGKLTNVDLTVAPFEPVFVSTIYSNILANIKTIQMQVTAGYTESKGVNLKVDTDADKQIIDALKLEMTSQITQLKQQAETAVIEKINEFSGGATADITSFNDIIAKLNEYKNYAENLSNQINKKMEEAENYYKNKANEAIDSAKTKAQENLKNSATDFLKSKIK